MSGQSKHSLVEALGGGGGVDGGGGGGGGGAGLGGAGGGGGGDGGIAIGLTSNFVKLFKAAREQCLSVWFRECSNDMHWNKEKIRLAVQAFALLWQVQQCLHCG